jgi:glycosyltransferase involved in cell wall biosynthesis
MHLIATNFYGGPEKQIVQHLKRLNSDHFLGQIASYLEYGGANELLDKAQKEGLIVHGIPMEGPLDFRAQFRLHNLISREKVDLLCVHGYKACVMGWWARRNLKVPVIAFSRGYTSENLKIAFYNWLERKAIGRLDGIIAVSEGQRKRLESLGIFGGKSWVVHNAISVNSAVPEPSAELRKKVFQNLGIPEDSKLVVTAGRLSPEKGHKYFVEAISKLGKTKDTIRFVFCGEGMCQKDLETESRKLHIHERCVFAGFRRDLDEIFPVMDLFVLPSLTEGLPNVLLEAYACAKPVVATNVGGVPEVVENGVSGLLVPPKRPDLLAEAIQRLLGSPHLMKTMGKAGHEKVKNEFSFEIQTGLLEKIYLETLAGDGRS